MEKEKTIRKTGVRRSGGPEIGVVDLWHGT